MSKCEVCDINEATTQIDYGEWKGKRVCEICKNNYDISCGGR